MIKSYGPRPGKRYRALDVGDKFLLKEGQAFAEWAKFASEDWVGRVRGKVEKVGGLNWNIGGQVSGWGVLEEDDLPAFNEYGEISP